MERRAIRTFEEQWHYGQPNLYVTSFGGSPESCISDEQPFHDVVNIMVGDLERIKSYPRRGFMTESIVPDEVNQAQQLLIDSGFTKHM